MSEASNIESCSICKLNIEPDEIKSKITAKGAESLKRKGILCSIGNYNHRECAVNFSKSKLSGGNDSKTKEQKEEGIISNLRNNQTYFDFLNNCCLCGQKISIYSSRKSRKTLDVTNNRLKDFWKSISENRSDYWGNEGCCKLETVLDLKTKLVL